MVFRTWVGSEFGPIRGNSFFFEPFWWGDVFILIEVRLKAQQNLVLNIILTQKLLVGLYSSTAFSERCVCWLSAETGRAHKITAKLPAYRSPSLKWEKMLTASFPTPRGGWIETEVIFRWRLSKHDHRLWHLNMWKQYLDFFFFPIFIFAFDKGRDVWGGWKQGVWQRWNYSEEWGGGDLEHI